MLTYTDICSSYDSIKDSLYIKAFNKNDRLHADAKRCPHYTFEDMNIFAYICIERTPDKVTGVAVTDALLNAYGVSKATLMEDARINSARMFPEKSVEKIGRSPRYIRLQRNECDEGGAVMFYPGVLEKYSAYIGGNAYVVPDVDEVILIKETAFNTDYYMKYHDRVLKKQTEQNSRLTSDVYYFDRLEGVIKSAYDHIVETTFERDEDILTLPNSLIHDQDEEEKCSIVSSVTM